MPFTPSVTEPADQDVVSQSDLVVRGETDRGARILINGQPAFVSAEGDFIEKLLLQPGLNTIVVAAANRFGKERIETLRIEAVFTPEQAPLDESALVPQDEHPIRLIISAPAKAVNVVVSADGVKVLSGRLEPGEKKEISADREIRVSSDNGKETYVEVGKEAPRALSSEEQSVQEAVFIPE